MKQFLAFVKKEFFHIFRDKRTVLILLAMPVVQIILFGFAITTEVKNAQIAIYDQSKDVVTQQIIQRLQANEYFTLVENISEPSQIEKLMKNGRVSMVLVFEPNFQENIEHLGKADLQVVVDATDPNQAKTMTNYVTSIIMQYQQEFIPLKSEVAPMQIVPQVRMLYNPQMVGAYNFVPGVMGLILMLICAMMTSISIVREKEKGSMEVLLASPIRPIFIIIAKAVPYFVISIGNLATILTLSVFVLNVPIAGSLTMIVAVSLLFILVALLLGLLISNLVKSQVAAMLISGMGLMTPTIILSGMMFPTESMPVILQGISSIIPARWYITIIKKLMIQGVDSVYIVTELGVLILMLLVLLAVSLKTFKKRL